MKSNRNRKRGQSLIEVIVAFAVVALVGMALITATLATQKTAISARNKSQATELVQQYLEQVRAIRDINGYSYISGLGVPTTNTCYKILNSTDPNPGLWTLNTSCTGATPYNGELVQLNNIDYYRKITFSTLPTSTSAVVQIDVTWKEGTNDRSVSQQTVISKWCGGAVSVSGGACPP